MIVYQFILWSHKHRQWWKPDAYGYTPNIDDAGRFNAQDAANHLFGDAWSGRVDQASTMVAAPESWGPAAPIVARRAAPREGNPITFAVASDKSVAVACHYCGKPLYWAETAPTAQRITVYDLSLITRRHALECEEPCSEGMVEEVIRARRR